MSLAACHNPMMESRKLHGGSNATVVGMKDVIGGGIWSPEKDMILRHLGTKTEFGMETVEFDSQK